MEPQAYVLDHRGDLGKEGLDERRRPAKRGEVKLRGGQLQRTQSGTDEARARRSPLGLQAHERKEARRADRETSNQLEQWKGQPWEDISNRDGLTAFNGETETCDNKQSVCLLTPSSRT